MCQTDCNHCVACKKSKVENHGESICYDKNGNRNCGYYRFCSMVSDDLYACKLYIPK